MIRINISLRKLFIFAVVILGGACLVYGYVFFTKHSFLKSHAPIVLDTKQMATLKDLDNLMPVVIIGSGPAGLAAGVYTARAGLQTLVIEGHKPGGLLTETTYIENWPGEGKVLGTELMAKFKKQNQDLGVHFLASSVDRVDFNAWPYKVHVDDGVTINALSVIVATGASPRRLGLANEQQYWSHGVSSCAVCDAPFFKNKDVVVVGGGDSAAEQVLQLAPHVKSVKMLVRKDVLRASKAMQDKVAAINNAQIIFNSQITQIIGNGQDVTGIELLEGNSKNNLAVDGIFLAIGHDPATNLFKDQLKMDQAQYLILQPGTQKTSKQGVFAAGEVVDHVYRQAGVAAGDGIKAALETIGFLQAIGLNSENSQHLQTQFFAPNKQTHLAIQKITTMQEFTDLVLNGDLPAVLDFYTDYCSACLHMLPYYQAAAYELQDQIRCFKVNADDSEELVRKFKVQRVPTFLIFKSGELVERVQQVMDKKQMLDLLRKYID